MNKSFYYLLYCLSFCLNSNAQNKKDSLVIGFHFKWKSEAFEMNKDYVSNKDTLQFHLIKFYISDIEINYTDGSYSKEENSFHLVDVEETKTNFISLSKKNNKSISEVKFNIGIDSTASVSGALSGDLDATKGMYWAWQSGYINMKVEGKSSSCKTRKNAFQFHIGGYLHPNYALRKVNINFNNNINKSNEISIKIDVSKLFENINLSETNMIMIPGEKAMQIADLSVKMFSTE